MVQPLCDLCHYLCPLLTGDTKLEAFYSEDIGFLFLNWLESGEASTSVILSQRASSRKDVCGSPSRLSAIYFYFCSSLISSWTLAQTRLLGRSGQQSEVCPVGTGPPESCSHVRFSSQTPSGAALQKKKASSLSAASRQIF